MNECMSKDVGIEVTASNNFSSSIEFFIVNKKIVIMRITRHRKLPWYKIVSCIIIQWEGCISVLQAIDLVKSLRLFCTTGIHEGDSRDREGFAGNCNRLHFFRN